MTAISAYFRTALLIDDRVEPDYGGLEKLGVGEGEDSSEEPESDLIPPSENDETPVSPSELVTAFLYEEIVCGVRQPTESDDLKALALLGAQIADVLILDWLLFGDDSATVDAIKEIAETRKDLLTVIVVFTGVLSLRKVSDRLIDAADFVEPHDFVLKHGNTIVLVFGKPGITLTDGEDVRTAEYSELPGMIREDLEWIFKGLMPEFAFGGINALRESTPRVLATFKSELDAGALVHRALLPEPSDAGVQFIRLLVSEFEQAMTERQVGNVWNIDSSSDSLMERISEGKLSNLAQKLKSSDRVESSSRNLDDEELVRTALADGLGKLGLRDTDITNRIGDLTAVFDNGEASSESLAILMCSSGFGQDPPILELGIVLRDSESNYWLCAQPLCDSVRLTGKRAFPMLPLSTDPKNPAVIFLSPEEESVVASIEISPYMLTMRTFDPGEEDTVVARDYLSRWTFTCVDGRHYIAVARLRPEIAAQAVHGLASAASRPGLDSSEWLRRTRSKR